MMNLKTGMGTAEVPEYTTAAAEFGAHAPGKALALALGKKNAYENNGRESSQLEVLWKCS